MDPHGNDARMLRAMVERLHELAEKYDETGQLDHRDDVNEAADHVGGLISLPDPSNDEDDE